MRTKEQIKIKNAKRTPESNKKFNDKRTAAEIKRTNALRKNDGYWTVYELPEGHIGMTKWKDVRMADHRNARGRDTNGWLELAITNSREEALDLECLYQTLSSKYKRADYIRLR